MRKILHNDRGESIVEVLVSFLMLLIVVGAFTTAIRGANTMMTKAADIRKEAFELELALQSKLYPGTESAPALDNADPKAYHFAQEGNPSANFDISASLGDIEVTSDGGETHIFREYAEVTP